jgi:hypothetical protein
MQHIMYEHVMNTKLSTALRQFFRVPPQKGNRLFVWDERRLGFFDFAGVFGHKEGKLIQL